MYFAFRKLQRFGFFILSLSVFYQVQHIFGHLTDSKLQYHEPESFWKVFKLWGQTINVHEQQDAFDFFQALIDQMDEQMKVSFSWILPKKIFTKKSCLIDLLIG